MPGVGLLRPADRRSNRQQRESDLDGHVQNDDYLRHGSIAYLTIFQGQRDIAMRWVTRQNASVDRIACPWLIKRFIDPDAEFLYVPASDVMAAAERDGAIPYDVAGVELGHVDGRCSFESILLKYGIDDPALERLARIVHGADVNEDVGITPEAAGLKAIAHGFALVHGANDHLKIELETPLYDALYAWCRHQEAKLRPAG